MLTVKAVSMFYKLSITVALEHTRQVAGAQLPPAVCRRRGGAAPGGIAEVDERLGVRVGGGGARSSSGRIILIRATNPGAALLQRTVVGFEIFIKKTSHP